MRPAARRSGDLLTAGPSQKGPTPGRQEKRRNLGSATWQKEEEEASSSPGPERQKAPKPLGPQHPSRTLAPPESAALRGQTRPEDAPPSLARMTGLEKHEHRPHLCSWRRAQPQEATWAQAAPPCSPFSSSPQASAKLHNKEEESEKASAARTTLTDPPRCSPSASGA